MWRSAARSIGTCLALLCFFAVSSADPSPPSRADVTSGVRVAQRLIDTIPSPWRLDGDVRMAGDDAPVAQGNFVQASYALNKASLDSVATFSRAGNAMQFDSSGYLTYGPNNLLTQSNTFSNAAWSTVTATVTSGVTDPLGGTSAFTVTANGAMSQFYYTFASTAPAGANAITSFWIRRRAGTGAISFYDMTGSVTAVTGSVTSSWAQVSVKKTIATGTVYAGLLLATSGDAVDIYAATVSAVTYETTPRSQDQVITTSAAYYGPRFDYNPATLAASGLLVEGASTNSAPQTGFASGWSAQGLSTGTDGTLNLMGAAARKQTLNALNEVHSQYSSSTITTTAGSTYTLAWDVKAGTYSKIIVNAGDGTRYAAAVFDISGTSDVSATQTASVSHTGVSGSGKYLGNGWFRLSLTFTAAASSAAHFLEVGAAAATTGNTFNGFGETTAWTSAGTETYYIASPQYEVSAFATSFIPNYSTSTTRAAETVQLTGAALTALQGSAATFIAEWTSGVSPLSSNAYIFTASGGSGLRIWTTNSYRLTNGTNTIDATLPSGNVQQVQRTAFAFSAAGRSTVASGGTVATDANGAAMSGNMYLGSNLGSTAFINEHIRSVGIYNSRLPDATLQSKSVVGASYAANDNGIRYAFADNDNLPVHWRIAL